MDRSAEEDVLPGGFQQPLSVFVAGTSRSLLKWVASALLAPYSSRVYWTDLRVTGETLEPLDPIALHAVPDERVHVLHPRELQRDEQGCRLTEAAVATVLRSDEPPDDLQRTSEFLRLPLHTQERISSMCYGGEPSILVTANAHRLVGLYPIETIGPMVRSILDSGTCFILLWADAVPSLRTLFDVVLQVEGSGPAHWRDATVRCEKGILTGPLGSGRPCRLSDLPLVAEVLERSIPMPSIQ
jgi:hypothetical protein